VRAMIDDIRAEGFEKIRNRAKADERRPQHGIRRLLLSVWLYCYSEQMTSAGDRGRMEYEPD